MDGIALLVVLVVRDGIALLVVVVDRDAPVVDERAESGVVDG